MYEVLIQRLEKGFFEETRAIALLATVSSEDTPDAHFYIFYLHILMSKPHR